jgi:hypothetical protein
MKSDKAPDISLLTTDMLKNLPNNALEFIMEPIQEFWTQVMDFSSWHVWVYCTKAKETSKTLIITEVFAEKNHVQK